MLDLLANYNSDAFSAWLNADYGRRCATCWRHQSTTRGNPNNRQWQSAVQSG